MQTDCDELTCGIHIGAHSDILFAPKKHFSNKFSFEKVVYNSLYGHYSSFQEKLKISGVSDNRTAYAGPVKRFPVGLTFLLNSLIESKSESFIGFLGREVKYQELDSSIIISIMAAFPQVVDFIKVQMDSYLHHLPLMFKGDGRYIFETKPGNLQEFDLFRSIREGIKDGLLLEKADFLEIFSSEKRSEFLAVGGGVVRVCHTSDPLYHLRVRNKKYSLSQDSLVDQIAHLVNDLSEFLEEHHSESEIWISSLNPLIGSCLAYCIGRESICKSVMLLDLVFGINQHLALLKFLSSRESKILLIFESVSTVWFMEKCELEVEDD